MPYAPNNPAVYGGTQLFGGADSAPRFTGPININMQGNAAGMVMQMGLPMLMQGMMQRSGMVPGQFFPSQNMFDQMIAQQHFMGQQQAMSMASRRDAAFVEDFLGGGQRMFTGRAPSPQEQQRNFQIARQVAQLTPIMSHILGPELTDQLYGSRGSATILAQRMHAAGRTAIDPVTGQIGMTGDSAAMLSGEIFERLYGRGSSPASMRGIRAGQAGAMLEQMQIRGLMGSGQLRAATPLDEGAIQRIAERLPEMQGVTPNTVGGAAALERAKDKVRATQSQISGAAASGRALGPEEIGRLAGGEDVLRAGDAQRMGQKLKNMSGAVAAMKEIFGDMGHKGTMQEIFNGLEELTQGGMSHMSPAQVERIVRTTHAIARQSGMGMQAMRGLTAQAAGMADQLGLDRSLAVQATQGAALFGAAAGNTRGLDIPAWGSLSKDQLTLLDQQLRMTAAASPAVNQINAAMRMADEGVMKAKTGSELEAMLAAARNGQSSYVFGGKSKSMLMNRGQMMDLMKRDSGVTDDAAMTYMLDQYGNQEYGEKYGSMELGREIQREEVIGLTGGTFASRVAVASKGKLGGALNASIGNAMSEALFNMTPEELRDTAARNQALASTARNSLRAHFRSKMPGATEAQIEAAANSAERSFGGAEALAGGALAALNTSIRTDPRTAGYNNFIGMVDAHSNHPEARRQRREITSNVAMATALGGMNADEPLSRVMDAIKGATAETTAGDILSRIMGGVPIEEMAKSDIVIAGVQDAITRSNSAERDAAGDITAGGRATRDDQARLISALRQGGSVAAAELKRLIASGKPVSEKVRSQLTEAAGTRGGADARLKKLGYEWGRNSTYAGVTADEDAFLAQQGELPSVEDTAGRESGVDVRREGGVAAGGGGASKMTLDGTLTIIAPNKGTLQASGNPDVGSTPVISGGGG